MPKISSISARVRGKSLENWYCGLTDWRTDRWTECKPKVPFGFASRALKTDACHGKGEKHCEICYQYFLTFSFSHNVSKCFPSLCCLTLSQTSPGFYVSAVQVFWKPMWEKEIFLFSQCFLPVWRTLCHFPQNWSCHLQTLSVWKILKFIVWELVGEGIVC